MDDKDDSEIESKVLDSVQALEKIIDKASKESNEEGTTSVAIMLEEVLENDGECHGNFNVSIFDFTRETEAMATGGVLEPSISTCVAYGLLSLLEKDTEKIVSEGYKFLTEKIKDEINKKKEAPVVSFADYKKSVDTKTIDLPLTSKMKFGIKEEEPDEGA
tara:strand:- start:1163 stop:1645 length:483 start_codon:yes stop_codon:yes gene_type:complete